MTAAALLGFAGISSVQAAESDRALQTANPQFSFGTAFAITGDGDLVTNEHIVAGCNSVDARLGPDELQGAVTIRDQNSDLALIRLGKKTPNFAVLRRRPDVRPGDSAITFGFPLPGTLARDGNLTAGYVSALRGVSDNPNYIQVTTPIQPGASGGALLDGSGNVIGVIGKRLNPERFPPQGGPPQLLNFAVSLDALRSFLIKNGIPLTERDSSGDLRLADIGDQARLFSYAIRCAPNKDISAAAAPVEMSLPAAGSYEPVVLYEEDLATPPGASFAGSVVWWVETLAPEGGRSPRTVVHGDIRIPGRITGMLTVGETLDDNAQINCRIEIAFVTTKSPRGEVVSTLGILSKASAQVKGTPLSLRPIQTNPNSFVFLGNQNDLRQNLKLLKEQAWIDLPITYKDGHRAIVALSKGVSGQRAFNDVLAGAD